MRYVWTPARDAVLSHEWLDGTAIKIIADIIGLSPHSVARRRAELGLPPRVVNGRAYKDLYITMPPNEIELVHKRAAAQRKTTSAYVRNLVRADLASAARSVSHIPTEHTAQGLRASPTAPAQMTFASRLSE